jgi:uncharacterized phage protein (TIGR02220 family)
MKMKFTPYYHELEGLGLSQSEVLIFGIFQRLSGFEDQVRISSGSIARELKLTPRHVYRCIQNLESKGLLKAFRQNGKITNYEVDFTPIFDGVKNKISDMGVTGDKMSPVTKCHWFGDDGYNIYNNIYNNINNNNIKNTNNVGEETVSDISRTNRKKNLDSVKEVVDHLNSLLQTRYKPTSKAVAKFINARLNDGASVEALKGVASQQVTAWSGTDMEKYLRPETLYNATKFEGYYQVWLKGKKLNTDKPRENLMANKVLNGYKGDSDYETVDGGDNLSPKKDEGNL